MKLLVVNGSYRAERGYTRFLTNLLVEGAESAGAQCEVLDLAHMRIRHCLACDACQQSEKRLRCVLEDQDDVSAIFAKMAAADLLVFATPVYVFGFSALLKTLLERLYGICDSSLLRATRSGLMFHDIRPEVCSKPFVTLICCDNLENETPRNTISYFQTYARFMDAPRVGVLVRNGGLLVGQGSDPQAEARFPRIREVYAAYRQAGRDLALTGRIQPSTQRKANQEIIPVPFFGWLKRLRLRGLKQVFAQKAQEMKAGLRSGQ